MKRLALLIGATAAVSAAAVGSWLVLRTDPAVTVVVVNAGGKAIASVRLEHERGAALIERLAPGETKSVRFSPGGETSYRLRVRFADGSELTGGGGYAEAGYELTETVTESSIETRTRLPGGYGRSL